MPNNNQLNPAGRVDVLITRIADRLLERLIEPHPLSQRLKGAGVNVRSLAVEMLAGHLKRERVTDVKSVVRRLRRG